MAQSFSISLDIPLSASLYLVATPIGNLGDITIRALQTLVNADHLFCEDTRMTKKLLHALHLETQAKFNVYNDHTGDETRQYIIDLIAQGQSVALVSDAGMPLISDPGFKLVRACHTQGIPVTVVPGASAVLSALSLSGLPTNHFQFTGFVPTKQIMRSDFLQEALAFSGTTIAYEAASRLPKTIEALSNMDTECDVVIARELTKKFEEIIIGKASDILNKINNLKGEIVVLIKGKGASQSYDIETLLKEMMQDHSLKEAVQIVADQTEKPRKEIYKIALALKDG